MWSLLAGESCVDGDGDAQQPTCLDLPGPPLDGWDTDCFALGHFLLESLSGHFLPFAFQLHVMNYKIIYMLHLCV